MRRFEIIRAGVDGPHGYAGRPAEAAGGAGGSGTNGLPGTDAPDTTIYLNYDSTRQCAVLSIAGGATYEVPLASLASSLYEIKAYGGNGGWGGYGAGGRGGFNGMPGAPATAGSVGGRGGPGGPGGNGGHGGSAGNGGKGGVVRIVVNPTDTDLLMLLEKVDVSAGKAGTPGRGGAGGAGGRGGPGGPGYSWSTKELRSEMRALTVYTDKGPVTQTRLVDYYVTVEHYNPGGSAGPDGPPGAHGLNGLPGIDGAAGNFSILLNGHEALYGDRYNLIIRGFYLHAVDPDGVIEPDESLFLQSLTLQNNGLMATPAQVITVRLIDNEWISVPAETHSITYPINPGEMHSLTTPANFKIKQNFALVPNRIPRAIALLQWEAIVERVNKNFSQLAIQQKKLTVGYPVQMSLIHGAKSVSATEEAPILVQIKNFSRRAIGRTAERARLLDVEISSSSPYAADLEWQAETGSVHSISAIVPYPFATLDAGYLSYVKGFVYFRNPEIPLYTQIPLSVRLYLGHPLAPLETRMLIQESTFSLQLSEAYRFDPLADFVLVINSFTTREQVTRWQEILRGINARVSIWNVSLYTGIDYSFIRSDGQSFMSQLSGKVLIILNNIYQRDNRVNRSVFMNDLTIKEIYQAALQANIATYVVDAASTNTLFRHGLMEKISGVVEERLEGFTPAETTLLSNGSLSYQRFSLGEPLLRKAVVYNYNSYFSSPQPAHLINEAKRVATQLAAEAPDALHIISYCFQPRILVKGCFTNKVLVGTIQAWRCLSATSAKIATKFNSNFLPGEDDFFNILKLLPFNRKLYYLVRNYESSNVNTLLSIILSDLTDEQYTWRQANWSGNFTRNRLKQFLYCINTLRTFNYDQMPYTIIGRNVLRTLFINYEALIKLLPTTIDYLWFYRRGRILTELCQAVINELITRVYDLDDAEDRKSLSSYRSHCTQVMQGLKKTDLAFHYTNTRSRTSTLFQHYAAGAVIYNEETIPSSPGTPDRSIVEERYRFFGPDAETRRAEALSSFETASSADLIAHSHYPPEAVIVEGPDNLASTITYPGIVTASVRPGIVPG